MALEQPFNDTDMWFIGEDKILKYAIYALDGVTPENITGWDLRFDVRKKDSSPTAVLTKTSGAGITITGTYDVSPSINTQRVEISIADTDTNDLKPFTYRYSLKRMNDTGEAILAFGNLVLRQATVR